MSAARLVGLLAYLAGAAALGAEQLPPPPPPPPPPSSELPPPPPPPAETPGEGGECSPACRHGYVCDRGACVPSEGAQWAGEGARPVPRGKHYELQTRKGMWITGIALLGGGWLFTSLLTLYVGMLANFDWQTYLAVVPVVGPLLAAGTHSMAGRRTESIVWFSALLSTGLQVAGLTLAVVGLLAKAEVLVDDEASVGSPLHGVRWGLAPWAPGGPGATFTLSF